MAEVIQIYVGPNKIRGEEGTAPRRLSPKLSRIIADFPDASISIGSREMDAHYFVYGVRDAQAADSMVERINSLNGYCAKRKI